MDQERIRTILREVKNQDLDVEAAYVKLKNLPFENLGFACLDHHREMRKNMPEVVYCPGKELEQLVAIFQAMMHSSQTVIGTKADIMVFRQLRDKIPELRYHDRARIIYWQEKKPATLGQVALLTAGTSDIPIAEEAAVCLELMGVQVQRVFDVGVAGIHRLFDKIGVINEAQVVIVVAGMEGALPSVVAGLTRRPVIAVPTSVGYGASFHGMAALLAMLNSCAGGIGVVNIDNGYGAAALSFAILNSIKA